MGAFKNSPLPPPKPPGGGGGGNLAAMQGSKKPSPFQAKMQEMNARADAQARSGNMAGANQTAASIERMQNAYDAKRGK